MAKFALKAISLLMLAFALATGPTLTEAQVTDTITIQIPFDFAAGDAVLPQGKYVISRASTSSSAYLIQRVDGKATAAVLSSGTISGSDFPERAKLVFHRYGDTYCLSQVWMPASGTGVQISRSKTERLAQNHTAPELVTLVARSR